MSFKKIFVFILSLVVVFSLVIFAPRFLKAKNLQNKNFELASPKAVSQEQLGLESTNESPNEPSEEFLVTRVIDGDTIELENGQKIRYIGINTPETVHPAKPVECFGHEASAKNRELVEGKNVVLEKDISQTDKYGRLLRYVYLPHNQNQDRIFINDYLVRQGFAFSSTFPPDVKYQDQFLNAEQEARQNNRGLWVACSQDSNPQPSFVDQIGNNQSNPNGCLIKGNISSNGERIYHLPDQHYYNQTVIDESKGEKWFCTENEAISAGWRKSKI